MKMLLLLTLLLAGQFGFAQSCKTQTTTCMTLTWSANGMAGSITSDANGWTSGPGSTYVLYCVGAGSNCSTSTRDAYLGSLQPGQTPIQSVWTNAKIPQLSPNGTYTAIVGYGTLVNFSVASQWNNGTGGQGGQISAASPIFQTTIGQAPPVIQTPPVPGGITGTQNNTGTPTVPQPQ
jgi:hypothetical protein